MSIYGIPQEGIESISIYSFHSERENANSDSGTSGEESGTGGLTNRDWLTRVSGVRAA